MDIAKNKKHCLTQEYLAAAQLLELIEDIERCATMLVDAAKKAKASCKKNKERLIPSN